jgi:hypothetical protein
MFINVLSMCVGVITAIIMFIKFYYLLNIVCLPDYGQLWPKHAATLFLTNRCVGWAVKKYVIECCIAQANEMKSVYNLSICRRQNEMSQSSLESYELSLYQVRTLGHC